MRRTAVAVSVGVLALTVAGCNGDDVADDGEAAEDTVTFRAVGAEPFEDAPTSVPAGDVTVQLVNDDEMGHSLRIEELDDGVDVIAGGEEATATLSFEAGTSYTYFCDVPGHRDLGMEGEFTAEG